MKNFRGFALGLALGLAAALSTVGWAQNSKPADQNKTTESCCAMMGATGDSCSMKDHQHKDHANGQAGHEGCCCCSDSCDMKMEHKEKVN
jgi:hypothetical protein